MKKFYLLPVERVNNTDKIAGIEYIHDAVVHYGVTPERASVIQDTSPEEDAALSALAIEVRDATPEEAAQLDTLPVSPEPTADELRAEEILSYSPAVITQPEMWEIIRIFGKKLGYKFD